MKLKTYGSGSAGNCHCLIDSKGRVLVLDAGIKPKLIFRDIMPDAIDGVLVTHEHGDHAAYISAFEDMFVPVYKPIEMGGTIEARKMMELGSFDVIPMLLNHDVPCYGYLIRHAELAEPILYATDTNGIRYTFNRLALAIIEADYELERLKDNLQNGLIDKHRAMRVHNSHQSLVQAIGFIQQNVKHTNEILLVHLSHDNADGKLFKNRMEKETGILTHIAHAGFEMNINSF